MPAKTTPRKGPQKPESPPTRGGARPGAGRPPTDPSERLYKIAVMLPQYLIDLARTWGEDNLSAGVRQALEAYADSKQRPT